MTKDKFEKLTEINRRRLMKGIAGVSAASMAGCIDQFGGSEGGTLNMAQSKSPVEFDPVVLNDVPSAEIAQFIYHGLYEYDETTGHVPALATDMPEVNDAQDEYVVEIDGDAQFHDGEPVTAEDVKHSFLAPVQEGTDNANEVSMIDSIDTVDEQTVRFNLQYPYAPFTYTLHRNIVPKHLRGSESDREEFSTENPVGAGPFEFVDWTEGDFVEIESWGDYWGDTQPNLQTIEFTPVEEGTTRITTLRNGDNDVIKGIPPDLWSEVEGMDEASIEQVAGVGYFYLAFNCNDGPTTDPQVRQAIDHVFDMDQAVSSFVEPTGVRQYSPYPQVIIDEWDFPADDWAEYHNEKDIEQAQQLFDEAGVSQDYSWRIIVPPDDKREQIGVTVANGLEEAGFSNTEVQRLDWGAFLNQYISGNSDDYNMYTLGWSGVPDPDSFAYFLLSGADDVAGVTDGTFWGVESDTGVEASDKFIQAREEGNYETRRELYIEGTELVMEEKPHIPAYNLKNSFGVSSNVSDFAAHSTDQFHLVSDHNNVSLDG